MNWERLNACFKSDRRVFELCGMRPEELKRDLPIRWGPRRERGSLFLKHSHRWARPAETEFAPSKKPSTLTWNGAAPRTGHARCPGC